MNPRGRRFVRIGILLAALSGSVWSQATAADEDSPLWQRLFERRLELIRSGEVKAPLLNRRQIASLQTVHFGAPAGWLALRKADARRAVNLPDEIETGRYRELVDRNDSEIFDYLDQLYGQRDDLKALAVRDSDGDGVPDYTVSDYFGKFMECDIDVDGDGIRNSLDSFPYDPARGGRDSNDDGVPDVAGSFVDINNNGVPDSVDMALDNSTAEAAVIQQRLLEDYRIILVNRDAKIDGVLARAIDDSVRRVFRSHFDIASGMPTLRAIAVERTALLGPLTKAFVEDHTSAQTFSQTQTMIIYDEGRAVEDDIGLLGLVVHEIGHSHHMMLDFNAGDLPTENARTDFPAPNFVDLIRAFGWTQVGYYEGEFEGGLPVTPRFSYIGSNEPLFEYRGRTPQQWEQWVLGRYEELGEDPEYLKDASFADLHIVSDYSLSSPYEWYADNLLAYLVLVLERHALNTLPGFDQEESRLKVKSRLEAALRSIWPGFYHRNVAPEVVRHFSGVFPIAPADRDLLVERYIEPIVSAAD